MPDPDAALEQTIRELATLLARIYLRLCFRDNRPERLDSPETKSDSCDCG